jgi:heptosyltransferase I
MFCLAAAISAMELRYPADRVCIVLLTGLGDVINGLPLVNALKDDDPSRHITWVVEPGPAPILRHHPAVDVVEEYHKKRGVRGVRDLAREMAGRRFDLTLNLLVYAKSIWPTLLSRAPHRLGFDRQRSRDFVWIAANHHLDPHRRQHTLDHFLEFAEHLNLPVPSVEWRIPITDDERQAQAQFFARQDRPCVIIPTASANGRKDWLSDRWAAVVDALEHDFGYRAILVGGRGERETRIARDVVELTSGKPVWAMGTTIREMTWMIDGCALSIAPDTGPLHLARALETPVIGLYGHTNPWRVGPYRKYQDLWIDTYTEPHETPDPSRFDPKHGRMERITVRDVLDRVEIARERYL